MTINTGTGTVTVIGDLTPDIGVIGSIVFDQSGKLIGSAFGMTEAENILFDINPSTGAVTNKRTITGGFAPQGLGFVLPIIPVIEVPVDIKPGSCPNPLNVNEKGILSVAILGSRDFDVSTIDPASIKLNLVGATGPGVSPLRWSLGDVATPYLADHGGCHEVGPDGYMDLVLKFDTPSVVALSLSTYDDRTAVVLQITGNLQPDFSGTPIRGQDKVVIIKNAK